MPLLTLLRLEFSKLYNEDLCYKLHLLVSCTILFIPVNRGVATTNCTVFNAHTYAKRTPKPIFFKYLCIINFKMRNLYFSKNITLYPSYKNLKFCYYKIEQICRSAQIFEK